jgi:predicted acetyltransferase
LPACLELMDWCGQLKRGRGFGTAALALTLKEAHRRCLERVLLTVDCVVPSIKIIERNGGVFSSESVSENTGKRIKRYWIDTSR